MLQVYKKKEKSLDNPSGTELVQSLEELNKPFLICLSAQDSHDQSVFGMIKEGARAARVNTTDEMGAGFKIDEFPISFLGLKFIRDDVYGKNYEEIVDKLLYPYLTSGETKSAEEVKKLARRINFLTYCDGTLTYQNTEKYLEARLQNDGFAEKDIEDILSQITVTAIGTMVYPGDLQAKTTAFIDVNDTEIYTERSLGYKKLLQNKECKSIYGSLKESNNILYLFEGSGKHSLKEYFRDDVAVKPAISSVLSKFLQNSARNKKTGTLEEISMANIIQQLKIYGDASMDPSILLSSLDNSLSYDGAPRYTPEEAKLRHELDVVYAQMYKTNLQLESVKAANESKRKNISSIVDGLKEYSSETTFYQVLVSAKAWQPPIDRDVFGEPSDKVIRQAYEQMRLDDEHNIDGQKR